MGFLTRKGVTVGLIAGILGVTFTESIGVSIFKALNIALSVSSPRTNPVVPILVFVLITAAFGLFIYKRAHVQG